MARGGNRTGREWRNRWRIARECGFPIFEGNVGEWNRNQVKFAHWMQFYDSVYESIDRPDDFIINNDLLLDQWFESKIKEQESARSSRAIEKRGGTGRSAYNHNEVTIY